MYSVRNDCTRQTRDTDPVYILSIKNNTLF